MKRSLFLFMVVIAMSFSNAQIITDGLRYSSESINGTARYNALSGAFGALGGDYSAFSINPAGSAVFLQSGAAGSFSVTDRNNTSSYFNTSSEASETELDINQGGAVFVLEHSNQESNWKKFTLGLNYGITQNYEDELFVSGTGNRSIGDFFLAQAQGIPLNLLQLQTNESISDLYRFLGETEGTGAQNAFLGYQGFIIDPLNANDSENIEYSSNIANGTFDQRYYELKSGFNGKYTLNFAAQYTDRFYFGININTHSIDYRESTYLIETNANNGSTVNRVEFENNLSVVGNGFSTQVGGIAKISEELRLGLTYDSPTWYTISEESRQYLETERIDNDQTITSSIDPNTINIFEDYKYRTPGKISASAAYIFGQQGLLSFDYSYKDYSDLTFRGSQFSELNNEVQNSLKASSSFKVGGEYRIQNVSLRGGYHFEESPYKNGETVGDLNGFSLGLGYDFGEYKLDISYVRSEQDRNQQLYTTGLTSNASINSVTSNFGLTLSYQL